MHNLQLNFSCWESIRHLIRNTHLMISMIKLISGGNLMDMFNKNVTECPPNFQTVSHLAEGSWQSNCIYLSCSGNRLFLQCIKTPFLIMQIMINIVHHLHKMQMKEFHWSHNVKCNELQLNNFCVSINAENYDCNHFCPWDNKALFMFHCLQVFDVLVYSI